MEAKATHKYIGTSPRKMRLVIDLIKGKPVDNAIEILHFNPIYSIDVNRVFHNGLTGGHG